MNPEVSEPSAHDGGDQPPAQGAGTRAAPRRRGRRTGGADTRTRILNSASALFARHGYDATSLRQIAREADVDPALVHHYFDGKEDLFSATINLPLNPADIVGSLRRVPLEERAAALLTALLKVWDGPGQGALLAFARGALSSGARSVLLREAVSAVILKPLLDEVPGNRAERKRRVGMAASMLMGLILSRYLVSLEPVASMPADTLVALYAPGLQHFLTGTLKP